MRGSRARACQASRPLPKRRLFRTPGSPLIDDLPPDRAALEARIAEADALRRAREVELAEQRVRAESAEAQLASVRNTLSFGLGHALVEARTVRGLVRLPVRLVALWRAQRDKRRGLGTQAEEPAGSLVRLVAEARAHAQAGGPERARAWLKRRPGARRARARALTELALDTVSTDAAAALDLGLEAARLAGQEPRLPVLAAALHEAGLVRGPARLLDRLAPGNRHPALVVELDGELRALDAAAARPQAAPVSAILRSSGRTVLVIAPAASLPADDLASATAEAAKRTALAAGRPVVLALRAHPADPRAEALRQPQSDGSILLRLPAARDAGALAAAVQRLAAEEDVGLVHLVATGDPGELGVPDAARNSDLPLLVEWAGVPPWALAGPCERRDAARAQLRAGEAGAIAVAARAAPIVELLAEAGDTVAELGPLPAGPTLPDPQVTTDLRRELAIPADAIVLGCVLPLLADPGLAALIEGLGGWPEGAVLLVAGSGPARAGLEARTASLGVASRIRFAGPLLPGDLLPTLDLCRALILPRRDPRVIAADAMGAAHAARGLGLPLLATAEEARWLPDGAAVVPLADPASLPALAALPTRSAPAALPQDRLAGLYDRVG